MHPAMIVTDHEEEQPQDGAQHESQAASTNPAVVHMEAINVLLLSKTDAGYLRQQLESRGCRCWKANSTEELTAMADRQSFDLILSTSWLADQTLSQLQDSQCTVFVSYPVRKGCWWLPVLERGRRCLGEPALRGNEFAHLLGQWLRKIRRISTTAA